MSNPFKEIKQKRLLSKLSSRIQILPEEKTMEEMEISTAALPSNSVIENYIDTCDFYVLAVQDQEFVGGLASELKDVITEDANILLVTSDESEARRAFEEFENEVVYEGEIPETTEASTETTESDASESNLSTDIKQCMDILEKSFINLPDGDLRYALFNMKSQLAQLKKELDAGSIAKVEAATTEITNVDDAMKVVKEIAMKYFPNSKINARTGSLGKHSAFFSFTYGKELDDYPSRISNNDIMFGVFSISGFNEDTGAYEGGKLKLENGVGMTGLKINGQTVHKFNWKNTTLNPNKVFEKVENYFKEASEFLATEEGIKILEAYKKRLG